jgi:hypothetical protein
MKTKTYKGILEDDIFSCLKCGDYYLADAVQSDFKKGDIVFVRYYITDKEVTEEEAKKALIFKAFGGDVDKIVFVLDAYSEYSILELEEDLTIGGHNLISELNAYDGKFLTLIIQQAN